MSLQIPHVESVGHGRRYRRKVPADIQPVVGRKSWIHHWSGKVPEDRWIFEARRLARQHDLVIERARAGELLDATAVSDAEATARTILNQDANRRAAFIELATNDIFGVSADNPRGPWLTAVLKAMDHGGTYVPDIVSLAAAYERDKEALSAQGKTRSEKAIQVGVDAFSRIVGAKDVRQITPADVEAWMNAGRKAGQSPRTISRRGVSLKALVKRAYLKLGHTGMNPFAAFSFSVKASATDRMPFHRQHLDQIAAYMARSTRLKPETRALVLLARNTGCGPAELSGLTLADISLESAIPYIWIRPNRIRGVKTAMRDRRVPLVGDDVVAALNIVSQRATRNGKGRPRDTINLFRFHAERGADVTSAVLNKLIRSAGVPKSRRLSAYSWRHGMKEALRAAHVPEHIQRRILGHSGTAVADNYGSPSGRLEEARDAITKALPHLGDIDPLAYRPGELPKPKAKGAKS
ncbi:MAG: tyrosine-type recombinase/integrase [Alphaproteobacteria bacterium]|nr:tyrosine-type recombinase/integrase [Alphaproteobacteria bacterium]